MPLPYVLAIVTMIIASLWLVTRSRRRARARTQWNTALEAVARDVGLRLIEVRGHHSLARGKVGPHDIVIEPRGRGDLHLTVTCRGAQPAVMRATSDRLARLGFVEPPSAPTPVGDAAFDAAVVCWGLSPRLQSTLLGASRLREALRECMALGTVMHHGQLVMNLRPLQRSPEALSAAVINLVRIARALTEPGAPMPELSVFGTAAARSLALDDAVTAPVQLKNFLAQIAPGRGRAFWDASAHMVVWQGRVGTVPLQLACRPSPSAEPTVAAVSDHGLEGLTIHHDPHAAPGDSKRLWRPDEVARHFVAPGFYIQGTRSMLETQKARYAKLPKNVVRAILLTMRGERGAYLRFLPSRLVLSFREPLAEMYAPEGQLARSANLLAFVAQGFEAVEDEATHVLRSA